MRSNLSPTLAGALICGLVGCAHVSKRPERVNASVSEKNPAKLDGSVVTTAFHPPHVPALGEPMATAIESAPAVSPDLSGPQPVDAYIRQALAENRTVQAAFHNVQSLKYRIPQVTTLDDPVASNTIFPIPGVAPQYSLMGYNPYNLTLAQQFPWFGTLRLRGEVAEGDVLVALAELAAAQLDSVAAVKRAYFDLYVNQKTEEIINENRKILEDFRTLAKSRLETGGTQQDVLRAEVLLSELDREAANTQQGIATTRASLARQLHVSPETNLMTLPELPRAAIPAEMERLYQLAIAVRPELKGRLAAVARDEKAVELAKKRFYPNVTLGLTYMDMEKTNAMTPQTAGGMPNVGFFVGFNLPIYRAKYRAGVCEAEERTKADAKLYEAQRDETFGEIKDFMVQAKVQQDVIGLLRDNILPRMNTTLELARSDYAKGNVDVATVFSALREVLQIQLQIAQVEGELGKALASLERAVGTQINEHPPAHRAEAVVPTPNTPPLPPADSGPFRANAPAGSPEAGQPEPIKPGPL
ncbi:TolC family protein [Singulisphaera sp. Ch08]|uniref:TolC family protein n=1 Tax=Singulisphaera sp. Ch08 TaxID=3120278 RepID=A0AAU7CS02_9BACT